MSRSIRTLIVLTALLAMLALAPAAGASLSYLSSFGTAGKGMGEFVKPDGLAVDPTSGDIWVTDPLTGRVEKYESSGKFLLQFGKLGDKKAGGEEFWESVGPTGLAVEPSSGDVYVVDGGDARVDKFEANGKYVSDITLPLGQEPGQWVSPEGVAVDPVSNDVYVTDLSGRVYKFGSKGEYLAELGAGDGTGNGQFETPLGVAVDPSSQDVYVVDEGNNRVQKFDASGKLLFQIGCATGGCPVGEGPGQFYDPSFAVVDSHGDLYVSDGGSRVEQFNSAGEYLAQGGAEGEGPGQFSGAAGVGLSPSGEDLYVVDQTSPPRVETFSVTGASEAGGGKKEPTSTGPGSTGGTTGTGTTGTGTTGTGTTGTGASGVATLALSGSPSVKAGAISYSLTCTGPIGSSCQTTGTLTVAETVKGNRVAAVSHAKQKRKTVTVGSQSTVIQAGKTTTVTVELNAAGRKLLHQFGKLPAHLMVTLVSTTGAQSTVLTRTLTINAVKTKKKHAKK